MTAIPTDAYIRLMLDGASPASLDPLFFQAVATEGVLDPFRRLDGRIRIALDGTEYFCSRKIHFQRCSTRRRSCKYRQMAIALRRWTRFPAVDGRRAR
jgi:hypothetical protein